MLATVIGTIESAKVAQKVIDELLKAGFKDQDVEIRTDEESGEIDLFIALKIYKQ